jgi:hypothetical protein
MTTDPTTADGGGEMISPPTDNPSSPITQAIDLVIEYVKNESGKDPQAIDTIEALLEALLFYVKHVHRTDSDTTT